MLPLFLIAGIAGFLYGYAQVTQAQVQSGSAVAGYPPYLSNFINKEREKADTMRANTEKVRTESSKIADECSAAITQNSSSAQTPSEKVIQCANKMNALHATFKDALVSFGEFTESWQKVEERIQKGTETEWSAGTVESGRGGIKHLAEEFTAYRNTYFSNSCDFFASSATTPPSGFGSSFKVTGNNAPLIKTRCDALRMGAVAEIGDGETTTAIYERAYAYKDGKWDPLYLVSDSPKSGQWFLGKATTVLPFRGATTTPDVIVAYTCAKVNDQWKCGCRDKACTQSYWQIQGTKKAQ